MNLHTDILDTPDIFWDEVLDSNVDVSRSRVLKGALRKDLRGVSHLFGHRSSAAGDGFKMLFKLLDL